jgi:hypothetical protein
MEEYMKKKIECIYPDEALLVVPPEVFPRADSKRDRPPRKDFKRRTTSSRRPPRRSG